MARSGRKHRIGKAHVLAAINSGVIPTLESREYQGRVGEYLDWIATDDRGVELEITARIADENPDLGIIIHCMPTAYRGKEKGNDQ